MTKRVTSRTDPQSATLGCYQSPVDVARLIAVQERGIERKVRDMTEKVKLSEYVKVAEAAEILGVS